MGSIVPVKVSCTSRERLPLPPLEQIEQLAAILLQQADQDEAAATTAAGPADRRKKFAAGRGCVLPIAGSTVGSHSRLISRHLPAANFLRRSAGPAAVVAAASSWSACCSSMAASCSICSNGGRGKRSLLVQETLTGTMDPMINHSSSLASYTILC
eukprot:GHUV01029857.1.p1 GENE.GHUV01029857.1~~GHUV01029857.1.p1  ORF type:complete len:156 (-),score=42.98 GHUV01029857.1:942-1409(-)